MQRRPKGTIIGNHILNILLKHKIDLEHCCAQVFDVASAMASKSKGASAVIKRQQPQAKFVHCKSYCINLAVVFARKNEVIRGFMADLASVCFFLLFRPNGNNILKNLLISTRNYSKLVKPIVHT